MPGGRRNDYMLAKPPADASTKVAEALLQSEMLKSSPNSLLIRFDRPTDTSAALDVLRAIVTGTSRRETERRNFAFRFFGC